jgi:hypothetical protein
VDEWVSVLAEQRDLAAVYRRASAVPVDRVPDSDSPWVSGVGGYF